MCMHVCLMCCEGAQRLHEGGHCSSEGEVGWSGCCGDDNDDGGDDDSSGSACEDEWWETEGDMSDVSEEDGEGWSEGSWFLDSVTSGEGEEEEDDDEVFRFWGAEGTPEEEEEEEEEVSPADMTGLLSPPCSPVPPSFPSSGVPSFCFLLASSCSAGLWLATGASWLGAVLVGDWPLSCEWQRGHVSWTYSHFFRQPAWKKWLQGVMTALFMSWGREHKHTAAVSLYLFHFKTTLAYKMHQIHINSDSKKVGVLCKTLNKNRMQSFANELCSVETVYYHLLSYNMARS